MKTEIIYNKAERVRDVLRYISRFKNSLIVIHIDDELLNSPYYSSHIKDIAYLHETGFKVIIVPGAKHYIDTMLLNSGKKWETKDGTRITEDSEMSIIKMSAFDVSNKIMTSLAEEGLTAVIGNWVKARGKGVINGIDFKSAGEIDTINVQAINAVLNDGFIPIFPCIGWNSLGKPYNISSVNLASKVATKLNAEKLFFLTNDLSICNNNLSLPESISFAEDGSVPSLNLEEVDLLIDSNKNQNEAKIAQTIKLLIVAKQACSESVARCHIVNGLIDGTLLCEIFSDFGSGTMIYKNNYGGIRPMQKDDVPSVLNLIRPFVEKGILLPRSEETLIQSYSDYIIYELDGGIKACSALHIYDDGQAEIAAVAVDSVCGHIGIGQKLIDFLINKAKEQKLSTVFILTTQTSDWFEKIGFKPSTIESLPEKRKATWNKSRGSKVFRLDL